MLMCVHACSLACTSRVRLPCLLHLPRMPVSNELGLMAKLFMVLDDEPQWSGVLTPGRRKECLNRERMGVES